MAPRGMLKHSERHADHANHRHAKRHGKLGPAAQLRSRTRPREGERWCARRGAERGGQSRSRQSSAVKVGEASRSARRPPDGVGRAAGAGAAIAAEGGVPSARPGAAAARWTRSPRVALQRMPRQTWLADANKKEISLNLEKIEPSQSTTQIFNTLAAQARYQGCLCIGDQKACCPD